MIFVGDWVQVRPDKAAPAHLVGRVGQVVMIRRGGESRDDFARRRPVSDYLYVRIDGLGDTEFGLSADQVRPVPAPEDAP